MENALVAVPLRAVGLQGPVGQVILALSVVRNGDVDELVVCAGYPFELHEVKRKTFRNAPLKSSDADLWSNEIGDCAYGLLLALYGIQGELEGSGGAPI